MKNAKKACFRVHPPFWTFGPDIKTPKNPIWPELKCAKKVHSRPIRPILREPPFEGFGPFLGPFRHLFDKFDQTINLSETISTKYIDLFHIVHIIIKHRLIIILIYIINDYIYNPVEPVILF